MANPDIRRLVTKLVMAMPPPVLRALSGGEAMEISGRTLDAQFQMIAHAARNGPRLVDFPAHVARAAAAQRLKMSAPPMEPGVEVRDISIPTPNGALRARTYRPERQDPRAPVLVYLHMGGGVIGDLDTGHAFCAVLAREARCAVVSIDYRLAPEHPYPIGLDDSLLAFLWVRDNAGAFGAPDARAAIGGDSMGGNFAAVITQDLRRLGERQPVLQLLVYPAVDLASQTQSVSAFANAYPLSKQTLSWFMGHYAPEGAPERDLRLSPLRAEDLSGLAPAIVVTAGFDPLVDQGEIYAHRLLDAGVPVLYRCYDPLAHGFAAYTGVVRAADVACREIAGMVRQGFEGKLLECALPSRGRLGE
jgi:acetyl esterase/lipase